MSASWAGLGKCQSYLCYQVSVTRALSSISNAEFSFKHAPCYPLAAISANGSVAGAKGARLHELPALVAWYFWEAIRVLGRAAVASTPLAKETFKVLFIILIDEATAEFAVSEQSQNLRSCD